MDGTHGVQRRHRAHGHELPRLRHRYTHTIANLNHLGKIYEKLILKKVWAMMGDSLPSNHQHGFRPQHSTETATTSIFALIKRLFERKKKVILVTLDMSAAFDLLDKSILIPKLEAHGFPERIIAIYDDFLSDRKAVVQVGESISETFDQEDGCVLDLILCIIIKLIPIQVIR